MAACRVVASARLHLGFLDPDASLGRRYGSIGMAVGGIETEVVASPAAAFAAIGEEASRAAQLGEQFCRAFCMPPVQVEVVRAIPAHAGLGSGTQLALALGSAVAACGGRQVATRRIGQTLARGRRSGIGLAVFEQGGFVVDAGQGDSSLDPPPVSRVEVPETWRVVLIVDRAKRGLSGTDEREAFTRLPAFPRADAAHLCHLVLLRLLPALVERDFDAFSQALGEVQAINGDYFAPVQGGRRFVSAAVEAAVSYATQRFGYHGVGQSSWGPTGFVLVPDAAAASELTTALEREDYLNGAVDVLVCPPRNHGAVVERGESRASSPG